MYTYIPTHRFHSLQVLSIHKTYSIILYKSIIISTILMFQETRKLDCLYINHTELWWEGSGYLYHKLLRKVTLTASCLLLDFVGTHHPLPCNKQNFPNIFTKRKSFVIPSHPSILYFCCNPFELIFLSQSEIAAAMQSI